jgi:hypothetical protein
MTLLTETRERFLLTIVAQVPAERIVEIHFFQPIKQGGSESGVAVVAAWPEVEEGQENASAVVSDLDVDVRVDTDVDVATDAVVSEVAGEISGEIADETSGEISSESSDEISDENAPMTAGDASADAIDDTADESFGEDAVVSVDAASIESELPLDEAPPNEMPVDDVAVVDALASENRTKGRHTIYTALYRLTLKGPDRGKWETNVVAEADAPLVAVDAVVRGVQRRSGDVDDATRLDGDEVRALVQAKRAASGAA